MCSNIKIHILFLAKCGFFYICIIYVYIYAYIYICIYIGWMEDLWKCLKHFFHCCRSRIWCFRTNPILIGENLQELSGRKEMLGSFYSGKRLFHLLTVSCLIHKGLELDLVFFTYIEFYLESHFWSTLYSIIKMMKTIILTNHFVPTHCCIYPFTRDTFTNTVKQLRFYQG